MAFKRIGVLLFFLGTCLLLTACSPSDSADCANLPGNGPKIKIEGAWARAAEGGPSASDQMGGSGNSAAYMVINNCGAESETLISAASDVAGITEVHVTETRGGVTTMSLVQKIDLPAGKKVEFKEGGYHVMLMMLKQTINPGDPVAITLIFEKAGAIQFTAPARNP